MSNGEGDIYEYLSLGEINRRIFLDKNFHLQLVVKMINLYHCYGFAS